jgi:diguanylate cyclase (GGDEF)-like protein
MALAIALSRLITAKVRAIGKMFQTLQRGEAAEIPHSRIRELDEMSDTVRTVHERGREAAVSLTAAKADLETAQADALTGLPGRGRFLDLAERMRSEAFTRGGHGMAFLFIDLDGFKKVNDTLGHDEGDRVLAVTADIIRSAVREDDVAGRPGGDEFAACVSAPFGTVEAMSESIAARIVRRVAQIGNGIGCSIGIAAWPDLCADISCAMRRADEAMYEAKRLGKNRHVIFAAAPKSDGTPWASLTNSACPFEGPEERCLKGGRVASEQKLQFKFWYNGPSQNRCFPTCSGHRPRSARLPRLFPRQTLSE